MLPSARALARHLARTVLPARVVQPTRAAGAATPAAPAPPAATIRYPYHVPRNSRGSLPVYTDIRNAGTRYLVLIRNVDGNATVLAHELATSLFPPGSPDAARLRASVHRSKHIVLAGGRWKHHVLAWLRQKGF